MSGPKAMAGAVNDFLQRCVAKVASKAHPLTVVLGNEGGDMDSIVGSIYFAMLLDQSAKWGVENPVPAVNFPLEDLILRGDVAKLFQEVGLDASLLLSVKQSRSPDRFVDINSSNSSLYLYDHNKLTQSQAAAGCRVVGILDHHADEKMNLDLSPERRIIRTVGSACTLVAERYHVSDVDVPCPLLLDAPIVLDTVNFDPLQKKVTPEDVAMHQWLCKKMEDETYNATALYNKLAQWKNDVLSLTVSENLRRDYKRFDFVSAVKGGVMVTGTSSVPCSCQEFENRYGVAEVVSKAVHFMHERELDVLVFAFAGKVNGKHSREVAFCAKPMVMSIFFPFVEDAADGITFSQITHSSSADKAYTYASYSLSDPAVSRKKLVPALRKFLADGTERSLL